MNKWNKIKIKCHHHNLFSVCLYLLSNVFKSNMNKIRFRLIWPWRRACRVWRECRRRRSSTRRWWAVGSGRWGGCGCAREDRSSRRCRAATRPDRPRWYRRCPRSVAASNRSGPGEQCRPPARPISWISIWFCPNWCRCGANPWRPRSAGLALCALPPVRRTASATADAICLSRRADASAPAPRTSTGRKKMRIERWLLEIRLCRTLTVFRAGNTSCTSTEGGTSIDVHRRVTFRFKIPARLSLARINWPHKHFACNEKKKKKPDPSQKVAEMLILATRNRRDESMRSQSPVGLSTKKCQALSSDHSTSQTIKRQLNEFKY